MHEYLFSKACRKGYLFKKHPNRAEIKIKCWTDWKFKPENGESYNEGKDRFSKYFWDNIVATNKDEDNILVVSHGRIIRLFLSDFLVGGEEAKG
ncbi:MAG: histidine phosphatase family protein [Patescibacteria group bacterium]